MTFPEVLLLFMMAAVAACGDSAAGIDAYRDAGPHPEVAEVEILSCSSVGVTPLERAEAAPPGTAVKVGGRVDIAPRTCADDCGEPCCVCSGMPLLEGTDLQLAWGANSPSWCGVDSCGDVSCWPYRYHEIDYWLWGRVHEVGVLAVHGFCIQTTADALSGVYEGRMDVNGAEGWDQPVLRLTVTDDGRFLVEDRGDCASCRGSVDLQEARDIAIGDGTVAFTFDLAYWDTHPVRLEAASYEDCLGGFGRARYTELQDVEVRVNLCRVRE